VLNLLSACLQRCILSTRSPLYRSTNQAGAAGVDKVKSQIGLSRKWLKCMSSSLYKFVLMMPLLLGDKHTAWMLIMWPSDMSAEN